MWCYFGKRNGTIGREGGTGADSIAGGPGQSLSTYHTKEHA